MKSQKTKHIEKELCLKYKLTQEQLNDIITAPFDFQAKIMRGTMDSANLVFPSVRIPNFGTFYVPDYIQKKFKKEDGSISDSTQ